MNQWNQSGFDDDGNKIAVVDFPYDSVDGERNGDAEKLDSCRSSQETLIRALQIITAGNVTPEEAGRRAMMFQHWASPDGTQRQLADRMQVTAGRASQLFSEFKRHLKAFRN